MKRDILKLVAYGREWHDSGEWDDIEADMLEIHRRMRRKMTFEVLDEVRGALKAVSTKVQDILEETKKMSGNDREIERHYSNSNTDSHESEPSQEKEGREGGEPTLPLALVLKACPDILPYASERPRHWHDLVALAAFVRGMMGISPAAWAEAQRIMGPEIAAITVAGILQRVSEIKSPGGYLRALTRKAENGGFSPGPMIMALLQPGSQNRAS